MKAWFRWFWWCLCLVSGLGTVTGQGITAEPITAATISQLAPVRQIDFAGLTDPAGAPVEVVNGWFALHPDGSRIAVKSDANQVVLLDSSGEVQHLYTAPLDLPPGDLPATFIDAAFSPDGRWLVSAHTLGTDLYLVSLSLGEDNAPVEQVFRDAGYPTRVWISEANEVWLEMAPAITRADQRPFLLAARSLEPCADEPCPQRPTAYPSGPDSDPESFFRMGRIRQNAAVTVTQTFLAKRWDLYTGEVTASAQLTALPGMASLTPDQRFFAWRDNDSTALRLLDFETGDDRLIAPLGGEYSPFLLLNPAADVIIGVHVGWEPVVVAWRVSDGSRIELGQHRPCARPPDLAALTIAGARLVIGCDAGLEVWQVPS
jgi:hypothetical protein